MADGAEDGARPVAEAAAARVKRDRRGRRLAGGPKGAVRYSLALGNRICARVVSGEAMRTICADPDMPHRETVRQWAKTVPRFGEALRRSRLASGWVALGNRICVRLAEGERLSRICDEPDMPTLGLVWKWRERNPDFARDVELAQQVAAERLCDLGWEIAEKVTPADAFATHVKLLQLRWTAAAQSPRRFGRLKAAEPPGGDGGGGGLTVIVRRFTDPPEPGEAPGPRLPAPDGATAGDDGDAEQWV